MPEKWIYSKRFPRSEVDALAPENAPPIDAETSARLDRMFQRLLYEDCYVPNPQRVALSREWIAMAIRLSSEFEIDMDICEKSNCVCIELYLVCAAFMGEMKNLFAQLVLVCDDVSLFLLKGGSHDVLVSLTLYTHDRKK